MELSPRDDKRAQILNSPNGVGYGDAHMIGVKSSHQSEASSSKCHSSSYPLGSLSKCRHQNHGGGFVTSCKHVTCKVCLRAHVKSLVEKSMTTPEPSYDLIKIQLLCPEQRCGMELSKENIMDLLDMDTMKNYESWIRTACRDLYCVPSSDNRFCCIKCKDSMSKKCSSIPSNEGKEMDINNIEANQSRRTACGESIQCQDSWVCTNCDFSMCVACGFAFETQSKQSGCTGGHVCREATNYRINNLVTDLEVIFNEYTRGTMKSNPADGASCGKNTTGTINSENQPSTTTFYTDSSGTPFPLSDQYGSMENIKTVWGPGTGFGGNRHEDNSTEETVRKAEKELDCQAECVLKSLTDVLQKTAANQLQPNLGFSAHVLLGQENVVGRFLEYLVTNDSMMDICGRSELYLQLVDLLITLAQYPELLMLLMGSCVQSVKKGSNACFNVVNDSSIIMKMKNIYEQAKIIVNRFTDRNDEIDKEADFHVAKCLLDCYEKLSVAAEKQAAITECDLSVSGGIGSRMEEDEEAFLDQTTPVSKEGGSINMEDKVNSDHKNVLLYKECLRMLQFSEYPLIGAGSQGHTYGKYFDESGANPLSIDNTGVHNKKRMLYILKETASLTTSLPLEWESSIHVRVDPVRMDLLKALIVGPKGTPYQNGVFIFDIYLPPDYPQVPPQVHFLTTGCGMVRFNPNLYNSGKVCLSLLGTWDGPGWQPWRSTILQVLVSIQSLIFVADPFYNEPGNEMWTEDDDDEDKDDYGNYAACDAAEEENRSHRYNTLKVAILGALQEPDASFKDVITMHFLHKKDEIINQCNDWRKASGGPKHPLHKKVESTANEVIAELGKLSPL